MEETYTTEAIILNRKPFKESDLKVTLFCNQEGKIDLIARGAKKSASKLVGQLEPISRIRCLVIKGKQYDYLGSAVAVDSYISIKNDLEKIIWAGLGVRDFTRALKGREQSEAKDFFFLLDEYLSNQNSSTGNVESAYYIFLFKLLVLLGYKPEFEHCVLCGQKIIGEKIMFSYIESGLICPACLEPGSLQISKKTVDLFKAGKFARGENEELGVIKKYFDYIF